MTAPLHKLKQSEAKKLYPKMLATATKRNAKTIAAAWTSFACRGPRRALKAAALAFSPSLLNLAAAVEAFASPLRAAATVRAFLLVASASISG